MYTKLICAVLLIVISFGRIEGKRSRKNKYVNDEAQDSTPQPSVLTYSTFGFNDVGSYDGFVPSSPDYANYLNYNRDPSMKLYAPAFPSAADSGFGSNVAQTGEEQTNNNFQPASINYFTSPSADLKSEHKMVANDDVYGQNTAEALSYGAKLSAKSKNKILSDFNNTGINIFGSISSITDSDASNEKNTLGLHFPMPSETKVSSFETNTVHHNNYRQPLQSQIKENDAFQKPASNSNTNAVKYQKVVDFTSFKNNYPTSIENKFMENTQKPINVEALIDGQDNSNTNTYGKLSNQMYQTKYEYNKDTTSEKEEPSFNLFPPGNSFRYQDTSDNTNSINVGQNYKQNKFNSEYKDKIKNRPWYLNNNNEDKKNFKNNMKGYEYSTNHSSTSFKYDYDLPKREFNHSVDEIAPASSNHGFSSYQLPENEYTSFDSRPNIKNPFDVDNSNNNAQYSNINGLSFHNQVKPVEENTYEYKSPYTTIPTVSSNWGNIFKSTDFSIHKNHAWKPNNDDSDEIVHIPKKHLNQKLLKHFENKPNEWSYSNSHRPKPNYKHQSEWSLNNRYKSEEDLLGLRTHDTSSTSYLPNYKPSYNDFAEEVDYKKLVDKWRQNYMRAKQKDTLREYESYASDTKPIHVPMPRPYPIEVPHPVIVPVPQPYPVRVPIPKPVAVPVIRELTVPIEKLVPYPVFKKVPYPIEKPVPVPVEKQVHVPVMKPYPVAVPQVKPVFHHTKPHDDEPDSEEEYPVRPEKRPFNKKSKNNRYRPRSPRSRRPSRMTYQDRNKRRPPSRPSSNEHRYYRRPTSNREYGPPHRYHEEFDEYDEPSDFALYCKRTGKC